jgi:hypothetical protein
VATSRRPCRGHSIARPVPPPRGAVRAIECRPPNKRQAQSKQQAGEYFLFKPVFRSAYWPTCGSIEQREGRVNRDNVHGDIGLCKDQAATTASLSDVLRCTGNPGTCRERLCAAIGPFLACPCRSSLEEAGEERWLGGRAIQAVHQGAAMRGGAGRWGGSTGRAPRRAGRAAFRGRARAASARTTLAAWARTGASPCLGIRGGP